jgi:hypothetical protein
MRGPKSYGRVVGGILDPRYDRSYFTLVPCPRHGAEVCLEDHRNCEHFAGVCFDPESGVHQLYCRNRGE